MYKITTTNRLYLVGKIHEILDMLDRISMEYSYLKTYLKEERS